MKWIEWEVLRVKQVKWLNMKILDIREKEMPRGQVLHVTQINWLERQILRVS